MSKDKNIIDIRSIEFLINVNATEDTIKVQNCLNVFFSGNLDAKRFEISSVLGAYNNPIKILNLIIKDPVEIDDVLSKISSGLSEIEKIKLGRNLFQRISEKNVIFLRFKKVDLYRGKISLSNKSDVLKASIALYNPKTGSSKKIDIDMIKEFLMEKNLIIEQR